MSALTHPMKEATATSRPDRSGLLPTLGIFRAVMLVAGGVIGSGIVSQGRRDGGPSRLARSAVQRGLLAGVISSLCKSGRICT